MKRQRFSEEQIIGVRLVAFRDVCLCRQSMQTNAIAPSRTRAAALPSVVARKVVNRSSLISPLVPANAWSPKKRNLGQVLPNVRHAALRRRSPPSACRGVSKSRSADKSPS